MLESLNAALQPVSTIQQKVSVTQGAGLRFSEDTQTLQQAGLTFAVVPPHRQPSTHYSGTRCGPATWYRGDRTPTLTVDLG